MARTLALMVVAVGLGAAWAQGAWAAEARQPEELCAIETKRNEGLYGIPARLLNSISIVESGRYSREDKATLAWPWTVTAEGEGRYLPTKAEAIAEVRKLKARGVRNIDVGCMQVNLRYHPEAFADLDEAFDPAANVGYAARFLKGLYEATNHWVTAASYYHSQTPHLAAAYKERLMRVWDGSPALMAQPRSALAKVTPPKTGQTQVPVPSNADVARMREEYQSTVAETRLEARRIAAAYRKARLSEYKERRARMQESRRAAGLPADGY